jgi:hypothetical protein
MSVPNIVLLKNQVLLFQTNSKQGNIVDTVYCIFGEVVASNDLVTSVDIGDIVLFNPSESIIITQGGANYYITYVDNLIFKEI